MLKLKTSVVAVTLAVASISYAHAADPVVGGDEPGTFKLPGSETSVGFYGFVKVDVIKNLKAESSTGWEYDGGSIGITNDPSGVNSDSRKEKLNVTAQSSRFGFKSFTPTDFGKVSTVVEGDFVGSKYRLRHAYGNISTDWGNVLAGQYWSLFRSPESLPETLDFNGPGSFASIREPQVRYTSPNGSLGSFAAAIEVPSNGLSANSVIKIPALTAAWVKQGNWGTVALRGIGNPVQYETVATSTQGSSSKTAYGFGASLGGGFKITDSDLFQAIFTSGKGISQYVEDANYNPEIYINNSIKLTSVNGVTAGFQHQWTPKLRSNISYGHTRLGDQYRDAAAKPANRTLDVGFVNLIWTIAKNTELGVEFAHGQRKLSDGTSGKLDRFQTSFQFNF